jgi:hypothetical protein
MTVERMLKGHQVQFVYLLNAVMFALPCTHSWEAECVGSVPVVADRVELMSEAVLFGEVAPGQHTPPVAAVRSIWGLFEDPEKAAPVPALALADGQLEPGSCTVVSIRH